MQMNYVPTFITCRKGQSRRDDGWLVSNFSRLQYKGHMLMGKKKLIRQGNLSKEAEE